ncbi:hypothetical protein ACWJVF_00890 [Clostridioides difficile]|nr:hypothetical protein [Clostridioides difficile]MDC2929092.1 hypothetical protein [Clostridioides difficile]MDE3610773.1 hypothetical protein [Clostridioides difficile]MDM9791858.1 hypothetical protein [Clostridioides difficile]
MKCSNCGSVNIEKGILTTGGIYAETIGLKYVGYGKLDKVINKNFPVQSTIYSDLCLDCGEIVRTYIKDNTDRNWCKDEK